MTNLTEKNVPPLDITLVTISSNDTVGNTTENIYINYQPDGFRPGITTLISFCVAIFLVLIYLYFENFLSFVRRLCGHHKTMDIEDPACDVERPMQDLESNGTRSYATPADTPGKTSNSVPSLKSAVTVEEPGVPCDCGRVHLLRDCMNEKDLYAYEDLLRVIEDSTPEHRQNSDISNPNSSCETKSKTPIGFRGATVTPVVSILTTSESGSPISRQSLEDNFSIAPAKTRPSLGVHSALHDRMITQS